MALRDLLSEALKLTPPDNARRLATLREIQSAIDARDGATDADVVAIFSRIILEREQKAASFSAAGQSEMAKTERAEIDALRTMLRSGAPQPAAGPKTIKPALATELVEARRGRTPLLQNPDDLRRIGGRRLWRC